MGEDVFDVGMREFFGSYFQQERRRTRDEGRSFDNGLRSDILGLREQGVFQSLALLQIALRHTPCQSAHFAEEGLAFGHANGAARIKDVEGVRAFQNIVVRRQDETGIEAGVGFGFKGFVHLAQTVDVGDLEVVFAVLELFLMADRAVGNGLAPGFVPDRARVVKGDQDALETIGDLNRDGIERHTADLLEVGELGDLLPVHPDFPAQPPSRDGRLRPVIFHKADVVLARIDADRFERVEIKLLRVAGIGFQDDLKLGGLREAVRILAVAPVIGADGGFDVSHIPRLGAEHAQEGGGVHCPCADLGVIRLGNGAAVRRPEVLQFENDGLEGFFGHNGVQFCLIIAGGLYRIERIRY